MSKFRRQLMMANTGAAPVPPGPVLPYDAEVEYLEYDGLEYFDTGITPNQTIEFEAQIQPINANVGSYAILGTRNSSTNTGTTSLFALAIWSNGTNIALNDNGYDSGWKNVLSYSAPSVISITARKMYKDGTLAASSGKTNTFSFDVTYGLLRNHLIGNWDARRGTSGRIFYAKIWKDGELVRDYIPVRVEQTGYLYDRVTETLFGNAGTGDFILGNDKN